MECGVHSLPDEILVQIFSFLDPHSKVNASSACKRWMCVMNDYSKLLQDVCVYIEQFDTSDIPIMKFSSLTRKFCYFYFKNVLFKKKMTSFLKKYARQFYRLSFENCFFFEDEFLESYAKNHDCTNLQVLEMRDVNVCVMFGNLPKLKKLHITLANVLTDQAMLHLQEMAPLTLTEFGLSAQLVCDQRIINRYYSYDIMFKMLPVDVFLSFSAVEDFIRKRCSTIHTLDLSGSNITDKAMMSLSRMEGLKLKTLKVCKCFGLAQILPSFCNNQLGIVTLHLEGILGLSNHSLEAICTSLPQLEDLNLTHCGNIDKSVVMVFQLKRLRRLDLTSNVRITRDSFSIAIDGLACRDLEYLSLSCTLISDNLLSRLLPLVPVLRELNLNNCDITDVGVSAISKNLNSLRSLSLKFCSMISDRAIQDLEEVGNDLGLSIKYPKLEGSN